MDLQELIVLRRRTTIQARAMLERAMLCSPREGIRRCEHPASRKCLAETWDRSLVRRWKELISQERFASFLSRAICGIDFPVSPGGILGIETIPAHAATSAGAANS